MLSDEVLEKVSERLIDRIETINTYILKKMGANIREIRKLNTTQAQQLAQILKYGGDYEKILQELAKVTNLNEQDIRDIFEETAKSNYEFSKQFYDYRGIDYIPYEQNYALKSQVEAITNLTARNIKQMMNPSLLGYGMINKQTGEIQFKGLQDTYYDLIDEAILSISQGKETFDEMLTRQLKTMGNGGLKAIYNSTYINKDGVIVNRSRRLDSSIRMNIQDGLRTLHNEMQDELGKEFGADGVEISVHQAPAPDHAEMQGRQFSKEEFNKLQIDGVAKDYEGKEIDINTTSKKGVVFHRPVSQYNCYHYVFSIVLGVSSREYTDEQLQEIIDENNKGFDIDGKHYTTYQGTQMQRRLETEIRKAKDTQILAKESGDVDLVRESQQRITQLTNKYKELSDVSGLPTKMNRMKVSEYRRTNVNKISNDVINIKPSNEFVEKAKGYNTRYLETVEKGDINKKTKEIEAQMSKLLNENDFGIRTSVEGLNNILKDGKIKSQFETDKSSTIINKEYRAQVEKTLFGYKEDMKPERRPVYGYLTNTDNGFEFSRKNSALKYGNVSVILNKDKLKDKTTFTFGDSLDGTRFDYKIPAPYNKPDINALSASRSLVDNNGTYTGKIGKDLYQITNNVSYVELQYHGGVDTKYIDKVYINTYIDAWDGRHNIDIDEKELAELEKLLKKNNIKYEIRK